ncbi:MAG: cell wall hydrolase [Bdellovibrionales bacterium]
MKDRFALITGAFFLFMASFSSKERVSNVRTSFGSLFGGGDTSDGVNVDGLSTQGKVEQFSKAKYPDGHTDYDIDIMARTIWGEARNEGYKGMQAVANVIMNRFELAQKNSAYARRFGKTVAQICRKPFQFSVWNEKDPNRAKLEKVTIIDHRFETAQEIARKAIEGRLSDVTSSADHYLNIEFTKEIRGGSLPNWADLTKTTRKIGAHTFLRLV